MNQPAPQRSFGRKVLLRVTGLLGTLAMIAVLGFWQYGKRFSIETETMGNAALPGRALTLLVVDTAKQRGAAAGVPTGSTEPLARAIERRLQAAGYQTQVFIAQAAEAQPGTTAAPGAAPAETEVLRQSQAQGTPVLRLALEELQYEEKSLKVVDESYRLTLLSPQLQPVWQAKLGRHVGKFEGVALMWHIGRGEKVPLPWESLSELTMASLRKDRVLP